MGGGGHAQPIQPPPPAPMPLPEMETEEAKKRVRQRYRGAYGRENTILAGQLMSERGKTLLGE